ncbi:MAG: molybdopterin-dependent oxidoreductase [Acidimicrobiaceae bacterium]|nr:molybdopterin-dependent oxidoreductase [Acidimicrobiaceae bacterium]MYH76791.1 molybdopterin-dependent oxidoreductase [Acidimicrobiaceae bacterium]MYK77129.1 molybdopterin-dependent oxidoreductase [Acidimicrobiaceae bacterium]
MSVLGRRVRPNQWNERTSGAAVYTTDVVLSGMLEARILRSPHPHADIRSIDTSRAEALSGVAAVITADDLPDRTYLHLGDPFRDRFALARGRVRFIGEEVAAVAARTRADADAALDLIDVAYKPRASAVTAQFARVGEAPTVHDDAIGNLAMQVVRSYGDPDTARSEAEVTVSGHYAYKPAAHVCLEPHSTVARWDAARQQLDLWVSTQAPYFVRKEVAHLLDLDMDQVRTHPVAVGGGFGAKAKAGCHEVIAAALAIRTKRPVRLVLDRDEEFAATAVRHAFGVQLATGARRDGTLTHRDGYVTVDNGAYNHAGPSVAIYATMLAAGPYRLGGCETAVSLVYTNKQPGASFRGYGNPQMTFATESQIDELAEKLAIDPIELRLLNTPRSGDVTLTGWRLGSARLDECLRRARDEIGWEAKRELAGGGRGVGVAAAVHVSGANAFEHSELSEAAVEVHDDGTARVCFAGADAGTGQAALLRQIAADELGLTFDDVSVTMMDSHDAPQDLGAWSSRGTMWSGHATADAARGAARALKETAAAKFGVGSAQVTLVGGEARSGADAVPIGDLVALAENESDGCLRVEGRYLTDVDKMDKEHGLGHFSPAYSFCVQAVEVEVDHATGQVKVVDAVTVHDSGAALNPAAAEGQAVGAMAMGLGAALGEELVYEQGRLINPSLLDYRAPRASDLPPIRAILLDGHDPAGPYGAKGIGEIGVVPTPAAVANAVAHATGVRVRELPLTPEKLLPLLNPHTSTARVSRGRPRPGALGWEMIWTDLMRSLYGRGLFKLLDRRARRRRSRRDPAAPVPEIEAIEQPATVAAAVEACATRPDGSDYLAGGTDLLVARQQRLTAPVRLIDTTSVSELRRLDETPSGDLRIGAAVTLEDLRRRMSAPDARPGDSMLSDLLEELATHQIRELATVGGNLLQEKRCAFYRNGFPCYKRSGWTSPCYAVLGDHRFHHAVLGGHRCQAVTPSDLATGLLALDAVAESVPSGSKPPRRREIDKLYAGPGEPDLAEAELLTQVSVPAAARARPAAFEKLRLYAGDFAVCSAAVSLALDEDGATIADARVSLGAVAPKPYRATRSEERLLGASLHDPEALREASWAWVYDTQPLPGNVWKVEATCGLLLRALKRLAGP